LISASRVLFCTDAEVMLTPQQNRTVHRFRQALYLYFSDESSDSLERKLSAPDPSSLMYRLGYWAEAVSFSAEERRQGVRQIQTDLIPFLKDIEQHDIKATNFFRDFTRVIVLDKRQGHAFDPDRLNSFLQLEEQDERGDFEVFYYTPK
jgi:hypothetical protein